jgi:hypothetical protein
MDMQQLIDALGDASRRTRSDYHLTLGGLVKALSEIAPGTLVEFEDGTPVGTERSYRGFYADLAFSSGSEPSTASDLLTTCARASVEVYTGYKGGDFAYDDSTPLWRAEYGDCGPAIIAAVEQDGKLILVTKDLAE